MIEETTIYLLICDACGTAAKLRRTGDSHEMPVGWTCQPHAGGSGRGPWRDLCPQCTRLGPPIPVEDHS